MSNPAGHAHPLLHRLREVPPNCVLSEAPAIPAVPEGFCLRIVDPDSEDPAMIAEWMSRPHLADTWEQAWSTERWHADVIARLDGTYSRPMIIGYEGRDVGLLDVYRPMRDEVGALYDSSAHDLGFHIAVAEPELTGQGIFTRFLAVVTRNLFNTDPLCDTIVAEPEYTNIPAHRVLQKLGFTDQGEHQSRPDRRVRLFTRSRATTAAT